MRNKDEQAPISPSVVARPISDSLIARYGILQAVDVARCIDAQVQAALTQQKRLHPEEWPAPKVQPAQSEPVQAKKIPTIPRVTG